MRTDPAPSDTSWSTPRPSVGVGAGRSSLLGIVICMMATGAARGQTFEEGSVGPNVTVGGWGSVTYTDSEEEGSKPGFNARRWNLYVAAEPSEGYRFFGEIEMENAFRFRPGPQGARGEGAILLERLYVERGFSNAHNLRAGKFFTPHGLYYRLHWPILTESISRPFSFDNNTTPRFQVGLQYWGRAFAGNTTFNYYAWMSDGPDQFGTNNRTVEDLGYGASVFATHRVGGSPDTSIVGTAGYYAQTVALPGSRAQQNQDDYVLGLELKTRYVELRGEYYQHGRDPGPDLSTWYASGLVWVWGRAGLTYRLDRGDDVSRTSAVSDHDATAHNIGALWRPRPSVLLKAEYRINRFRAESVADFKQLTLFAGIKF